MSRQSRDQSLHARLGRSYRLLALLLVLVGAVGAVSLVLVHRGYRDVFVQAEPLLDNNREVLQAMTDAETGLRGYELTGARSFLQPYHRGVALMPALLADADRAARTDPRGRSLVAAERHAAHAWVNGFAEPIVAGRELRPPQGKALFDAFRASNAEVNTYAQRRRANEHDEAVTVVRMAIAVFLTVLLAAILVSLREARRTTRSLLDPLESLQRTVTALARMDLDARAAEEGPAEIRVVADAVNHLAAEAERLRAIAFERERRDNAVRAVERALRTELDPKALLARAVGALGEILRVERVVIRTAEGGDRHPIAAEWTRNRGAGITDLVFRDVPAALLHRFEPYVAEQRALAVDDMAVSGWHESDARPVDQDAAGAGPDSAGPDKGTSDDGQDYVDALSIRAAVICPIVEAGRLIGFLSLHELSRARAWSSTDIAVTELAAREIAVALGQARLYDQQVRMVDRLTALDRERDVFVSTVSHELRTPLTSIAGYVELLTEGGAGELSGEQRAMLAVIDRNASRLRRLIEDLLTLSRIESGSFAVARVPLDLGPVLTGACAAMRATAELGGVTLICDQQAYGAHTQVAGDALQLERVALNLISNAVKFTPRGGTVRVRTFVEHGDFVLAVADTGIGIPAEEQPQLFQRFFRASTATDLAIPGTGLGLTVVASIVAAHGGRVDLLSDAGIGTTVVVRLPLVGQSAALR